MNATISSRPQIFEFRLEAQGSQLEIKVNSKKFDVELAKQFRAAVDEAWVDGIRGVTIDFSTVELIDSAGVGALISVHKRLPNPDPSKMGTIDPNHQPVAIRNASAAVLTIIEVLRLHRVFRLTKR